MYNQQGDVLMKQVKNMPKELKAIPDNLIHAGYSHNHTIEGDFELFTNENDFYVLAKNECKIVHPEHKTIMLTAGIYKKEIVKEYDHFLEESREVID